MSRQPQQLRPTLGVPHRHVAIIAPADQARAIGTPRDTVHAPAMAAQPPGRRPPSSPGHLPDGDQRIRAATDQLRAVWTPGEVVEGGRVALHNTQALFTGDLPEPHRAIVTAT